MSEMEIVKIDYEQREKEYLDTIKEIHEKTGKTPSYTTMKSIFPCYPYPFKHNNLVEKLGLPLLRIRNENGKFESVHSPEERKKKRRAYRRKYFRELPEERKEKIKKYHQVYYQKNKPKIIRAVRDYQEKQKNEELEKRRAQLRKAQRKYRERHGDRIEARRRAKKFWKKWNHVSIQLLCLFLTVFQKKTNEGE